MLRQKVCLWRRSVLAGAVLLAMPLAIYPQSPDSDSQAELIRELRARIDQLEQRMVQMEAALAVGTSPVRAKPETKLETPREAVAHTAGAEHPMGTATAPAGEPSTYPSLKIAGFSDFDFVATDQHGVKSGFNEGQFVLHLNSNLSQKVTVLGELSLTARTDAGTGTPPAAGFNVEVERSIIRFEENDYFKISFGRYHTPINYWNTEFHHGQWLQTTVSRPEMVQFGGKFIPVHFVGALVEGAVPAGGLNVNYNVGLGNGRGTIISRAGDFGDNNNSRAWLVNLFAKPNHPFGLQFGASVYRDKITPAAGLNAREWIQSGHIVWQKENPEFIAEFANITHETIAGRPSTFNSQAWYVQVGYRLPGIAVLWKPYYRFEYIHIPKSDPIFSGVPGLAGSVAGIRYDISSFAALKLEYRNQWRPDQSRVNGIFAQTSFTF
jgi:hypothetical protein